MELQVARRKSLYRNCIVLRDMVGIIVERKGYKRIHSRPGQSQSQQKICFNWQSSGHCYRHHCPFLHPQLPHDDNTSQSHPPKKQCHRQLPIVDNNNNPRRPTPRAFVWKNPNYNHHNRKNSYISSKPNPRNPNCDQPRLSQVQLILAAAVILLDLAQTMKTLLRCILARRLRTRRSVPIGLRVNATRVTVAGFCILGLLGSPFVCLATLKGHEKAVSGITLPQGSNKLFSACEDGVCAGSLNLGGKIRCVLGAVPWVFIVVPNAIKVFSCNPPNAVDLSLSGPVGQVYALDFVDGMLFAGIEDGTILSWRFNAGNLFEEAARFDGHKLSVVTLVARSYGKLYSGSTDHTLKVWDIRTSQCLQTLTDHKVGNLQVCYTHHVKHEMRLLCGMEDELHKPAIVCACNDSIVRLYDLPSGVSFSIYII
ncbi:hypothetical protein MRB53_016232 [Persea americana]|uniref:Uncharacterized protein n=1 Tax=Persea americana TaxID=3435 RepID=A0ACC2M254_PERAE|nr:hypothetical protein MRB53_016232 [Persea americana]